MCEASSSDPLGRQWHPLVWPPLLSQGKDPTMKAYWALESCCLGTRSKRQNTGKPAEVPESANATTIVREKNETKVCKRGDRQRSESNMSKLLLVAFPKW